MKHIYSFLVAAALLFSASASAQTFKIFKNGVAIATYNVSDVDSIQFVPSTSKKVTFDSDYFTSLIDDPQYGGPLLYPASGYDPEEDGPFDYIWVDEATTLSSNLTKQWGGYYGYAEGGIAISNYIETDLTNGDYNHQLAVPVESDGNFAVAFCPAFVTFDEAKTITSMDVMNTTYALNVIKNGNSMAKALTEVGSYLTITAQGYLNGEATNAVEFDLARDGVIVEDWQTVDFSALGAVDSIVFVATGSDTGDWGLNTPAYFAFDNVEVEDAVVPTPALSTTFEGDYFTALIDNPQYGGALLYPASGYDPDEDGPFDYIWADAATGLGSSLTKQWGGSYGYAEGGIAISNYIDADLTNGDFNHQLAVPVESDGNFAVAFCPAFVTFDEAKTITSMDVMNTTYALNVIKNGNSMAKALTDEGSYLSVTVTGYNGEEQTGTLTFDLARDGVAVEKWQTVDFSSLGAVTKVTFSATGSDTGDWGLNTPGYFAFDNVKITK